MTKPRQDGLTLFGLGVVAFVLFASALHYTTNDSIGDFKAVYNESRCLLQHCDPYSETELLHSYRPEFGDLNAFRRYHSGMLSVYIPSAFLVFAPFAMLPPVPASLLWIILTALSLILAAFLSWTFGADYAPILCGGLVGFLFANSVIVFGNGNPAGIVVGFCVIAVWCFLKERFVPAGIVCLAISLAIKPHVAGLVWLYFLLAGGVYRKRAMQTLAVTVMLGLAATLWISHVAPQWIPELRANFAEVAARGGNSDPGPAGLTSTSGTMNVIVDLQAAVSIFRDDPRFYNTVSYVVCGTLLLVWTIITLWSGYSRALTWFALAAVVPISMLVTYHRAYDAKLLLLTVPACAMLWAKGGRIGWVALLVNAAALVSTGEIPLAFFVPFSKNLHIGTAGLLAEIQAVVLTRPAPLSLLLMGIFYLWVYVRESRALAQMASPRRREVPTS